MISDIGISTLITLYTVYTTTKYNKNDRNGGIWQSGISKSLAGCPPPCVLRQCTVVFEWKCCLFCLCAHGQCRVYHIYHVEFHFQFGHQITFLVEYQLSRIMYNVLYIMHHAYCMILDEWLIVFEAWCCYKCLKCLKCQKICNIRAKHIIQITAHYHVLFVQLLHV